MKPGSQGFRTISNAEVEAERRCALRALLRNPLLSAAGETAEQYVLVRRHSEWLKQWLATFPVWSLHVDGELARLRKIPGEPSDDTRPAIDRSSGAAFTKHRYALLCLALAALEQLDRQTTLGQLAQTIMELLAVDRDLQTAGLFFDSTNYDQRRDLVHAVRFLVESGVLRKIDGDERQFRDKDSEDALYDINRHILAEILQGRHSPSSIEMASREMASRDAAAQRYGRDFRSARAARLNDDSMPATEEARGQWTRSRLVRTLLDDPVLYFHELNDEERSYLEKHRGPLLRELCEATGLIAEVRREGIALVDDAGDLTDLKLPDPNTEGHLSLLLVQWFAECSRNRRGEVISILEVEERVRDLIRAHGPEWHKDVREAGTELRLTEDALLRIRSLRLIQLSPDGVVPLPASCRYAAAEQI
jgi:uncharacterized protein (TIGR02678 family)